MGEWQIWPQASAIALELIGHLLNPVRYTSTWAMANLMVSMIA